MDRVLKITTTALLLLFLSLPAFAGTSIKINHATVEDLNLTLNGINFDIGPIDVMIGGNFLNCPIITPNLIECSMEGAPVLIEGGTWTVSISAGNAPAKNDEIDVYIPVGLIIQECNLGESVECYSGEPSTKDVGECKSGNRTCLSSGWWSVCEGEVTPELETCDDSLDNDCNGQINNGCSPLTFYVDGNFVVPADVTEINIAVRGAGGGGGGGAGSNIACGGQGGGGGGSGGYVLQTLQVAPGQSYNIHIGSGGFGGSLGGNSEDGGNGGTGGGSSFSDGSTNLHAEGGLGGGGGEVCGENDNSGQAGSGGNDGQPGSPCDKVLGSGGEGGLGGDPVAGAGNGCGYGGHGGNGDCGSQGANSGFNATNGCAVIWW